ncbi:MAG: hypothetical protein SF187_09860 [Deltaproteobacteria bacterium]|nr:hypothetical protein [Deltaproteobacteria bacterium]
MQNKTIRSQSADSSPSGKTPSPVDLFDDQDEDEPEDRSLAAFESLLAAQQRMKGIVECAGALNRLLAEAADGSSMPLNLPPLPPAFLAAAAAVRAQEERAMNLKTMSHLSAGSSSDPQEIPSAGYGRLEALIRMRGFITNSDMREAFNMSPIQATMRLKDLVAQRVLVQRGQRRGARYSTGPRWPPKT